MRIMWIGFVAMLLLLGGLAAADYTMSGGDPGNRGVSPNAISLPLALAWEFPARQYEENPCPVLMSDGKAIVFTRNIFFCLDIETGSELWRYPSKGTISSTIRTSPVVADGLIIVPLLSGEVSAYSLTDGSQAWAFDGKKPVRNAITVDRGIVYFGNSDSMLYAIDAASGTPRWTEPFKAGADVVSRPVISGDRVIVCSRDQHVYGVDVKSGKSLWRARLPYPTKTMSPAVSGDLVVVPTERDVLGLAAVSGSVRWEYPLKTNTVTTSVATDGRHVLFGTKEGMLYCLDGRGKELWKNTLASRIEAQPMISGDIVFATTNAGSIYAFGLDKGDLRWRYQIPSMQTTDGKWVDQGCYAPPAVDGDNMFFVTDMGWVYRFQKQIPDRGEPDISTFRPKTDTAISGRPPVKFSAFIRDAGSGINAASIQMLLDGVCVKHEYDEVTGMLTYETVVTQPVVPLSDGGHSVVIIASDWAGNKAERRYDLTVSNRLSGR